MPFETVLNIEVLRIGRLAATVLIGELEGRAIEEEVGEFGEFAPEGDEGEFGRFPRRPQRS